MQETQVQSLGREDPLEKGKATTLVFLGFPHGSDGKESAYNAGDLSLIPGLGRSPGGGHDNPLLPGEFYGQRDVMGYSSWGCEEWNTVEQLNTAQRSLASFSSLR